MGVFPAQQQQRTKAKPNERPPSPPRKQRSRQTRMHAARIVAVVPRRPQNLFSCFFLSPPLGRGDHHHHHHHQHAIHGYVLCSPISPTGKQQNPARPVTEPFPLPPAVAQSRCVADRQAGLVRCRVRIVPFPQKPAEACPPSRWARLGSDQATGVGPG